MHGARTIGTQSRIKMLSLQTSAAHLRAPIARQILMGINNDEYRTLFDIQLDKKQPTVTISW